MSKLRAVIPLPMPGITPGKLSSRLPRFTWAVPTHLLIEDDYQRNLTKRSITLIRQIIAQFDWTRIKPVVCALNDKGRLCVIDGQHTAIAAASHGGIKKIPVMVVDAPSIERRAASFVSHNMDRLHITPMQLFYSQLAAGDEIAAAMDKVCKAAGVTICRVQPANGRWKIGDTVAIANIRRIIEQKGEAGGRSVLKILVAARRAPVVTLEILAVRAILFEPQLGWDGEARDLIAVIQSKSIDGWMRQIKMRTSPEKPKPLWHRLAETWIRACRRESEGA